MRFSLAYARAFLAGTLILSASASMAQTDIPVGPVAPEAPYVVQLERLSEILGALHFLRNLCGEDTSVWREQMEKLIAREETYASRLTARFNRGYRTFAASYKHCTPAAIEAVDRYMEEGQSLADRIASQYRK
jgi:uncharacterized protein (TIGR02301 family)